MLGLNWRRKKPEEKWRRVRFTEISFQSESNDYLILVNVADLYVFKTAQEIIGPVHCRRCVYSRQDSSSVPTSPGIAMLAAGPPPPDRWFIFSPLIKGFSL